MMKKIAIIITILIVLIALPIIYMKILYIISGAPAGTSFFTVKELSGTDIVLIDNRNIGTTPLVTYKVTSGSHNITIKRKTSSKTASYYTLSKSLYFEPDTNSIITLELGPNDIYTYYSIYSFQKILHQSGILVNADMYNQEGALLTLNTKPLGNNVVAIEKPGNYTITYKQQGYISTSNQITLSDNYILINSIHLFKNPLQ